MNNSINQELCQSCGKCAEECPFKIIKKTEGNKFTFDVMRLSLCEHCSHCMAICPTKAIQVDNLNYEKDFIELSGEGYKADDFYNFLSSRRSIRCFEDKPVPKELLEKITDAISLAPMGIPPHKVDITIVQDKNVLKKAFPLLVKFYADFGKMMKIPLVPFLVKKQVPLEDYNTLTSFILPLMKMNIPLMQNQGEDFIIRNAPTLIIFHADRGAEVHSQDAVIEMTYGILAAHALGLGAMPNGIIPPAIDRNKELRSIFNIPAQNQVITSLLVGYPKYKFKRGIRRELKSVSWI